MNINDTVILNYDYDDLMAGTMGFCIGIDGDIYTIQFETGQVIPFNALFIDMDDYFEVVTS